MHPADDHRTVRAKLDLRGGNSRTGTRAANPIDRHCGMETGKPRLVREEASGDVTGQRCTGLVRVYAASQVKRALDLIAGTIVALAAAANEKPPIATLARQLARLLGDLETYVSGQAGIIIDYATARRCKEPISTVITGSTVQWLLHRRKCAQQQMR